MGRRVPVPPRPPANITPYVNVGERIESVFTCLVIFIFIFVVVAFLFTILKG